MNKFFSSFLMMVFALFAMPSFAVDTLEVFAIRVQFAEENPDNSLTTGNGHFDSDRKFEKSYTLDPVGRRSSASYWKKHFDFANAYYNRISNGNLVIKARIFPENSSAYKLKKQIIDYNRTSKMKGEKMAEFDEARSRDYLQFVYDAVVASHKSGDSPFEVPLSKDSHTKRVFMIIHAGANRLVDGGNMGTAHADTPGDFMDVFINPYYWEYLSDTLAYTAVKRDTVSKDSVHKVVTGLVLEESTIDTLKSIMVLSETASQDGLNWGVNGILVNQIARSLGLPDTYDAVKGTSRLGYYDMMDFAGYSAGNGFLPSIPAAWERVYMGWSNVKEVRPVAGKPVTVDLVAAGSGLSGTEVVKVPLSASEYLLIENRQRSWNKDGTIDVTLGSDDDGDETETITVPVDSLNLVFEDSVLVNKKNVVNKKKASGIITDVSSFDAAIPASGIVVWRVNDWFLKDNLQYGVVNYWGGDNLRDHQFGISLVEADGVLSIGKTFQNALGQDTYDYGSGTDLLPHKRYSKNKKYDEVTSIGAMGYANTKTTQGGYTGIKITASAPKDARKELSDNAFMGDSVYNYGALKISVTISIDDGSLEGSEFPRDVGLNSAVRGVVFVDHPEKDGEKLMVVGAEDGTLQAFDALGEPLLQADTALVRNEMDSKNSEKEIPLYRIGPSYGPLVGLAGDGKNVYSLHEKYLVKTSFEGGFPTQKSYAVDSATTGPMVLNGYVYFADRKGEARVAAEQFKEPEYETLNRNEYGNRVDGVSCGKASDGNDLVVYVTDQNQLVWNGSALNLEKALNLNSKKKESWHLACTDMDRDGAMDVLLVGSRGSAAAIRFDDRKENSFKVDVVWKKNYIRGAAGTSGLSDETSGIALGDVNSDGYPEVVFLGDNLVYALDRFGLPLPGFPVLISRGSPIYGFFSDPLLVDVTGDDIPEILVPSNDGLVYAFTGKGKQVAGQFPLAAGSFEYVDSLSHLKPMSIFVAGDKSKGAVVYAVHRNNATAFRLQKAASGAVQSSAAWILPAGGNERTGYLDASKLSAVDSMKAKDEITEFFMFPNPIRGGVAKARFEVGAEAESAVLELYDITGLCVFKQKMTDVVKGRNQYENLDLKTLGSDVYTARLKVKFKSGKTKQKKYRVGVIR